MGKLTEAQRRTLKEAQGCCPCVESYRPAQKMVELGLCKWTDDSLGTTYLDITPAGRTALKDRAGSLDTEGPGR